MREQVLVALVGLLRRRVARVLAHRPQLLAVHLAVRPARERELAGLAEPLRQPVGDVAVGVERLDLDPGVGEAARIVRAHDRGHGQVGRRPCPRWPWGLEATPRCRPPAPVEPRAPMLRSRFSAEPSRKATMVQTVAVGTDGSGTADKAVEFAIDLAARYEAKIVFISAYDPVSESRLRREATRGARRPAVDDQPGRGRRRDAARLRGARRGARAALGERGAPGRPGEGARRAGRRATGPTCW